jgi:hypothetical protein
MARDNAAIKCPAKYLWSPPRYMLSSIRCSLSCRDRALIFNRRYWHDGISLPRRRVPAYAFRIRAGDHAGKSTELQASSKPDAEESTIHGRTNDAIVSFRMSLDISFIGSDYLSRYFHR